MKAAGKDPALLAAAPFAGARYARLFAGLQARCLFHNEVPDELKAEDCGALMLSSIGALTAGAVA